MIFKKKFANFSQKFVRIFQMFFKIHLKFLRKFCSKFSNIFANFSKTKTFSIAPLCPPVESLATALRGAIHRASKAKFNNFIIKKVKTIARLY